MPLTARSAGDRIVAGRGPANGPGPVSIGPLRPRMMQLGARCTAGRTFCGMSGSRRCRSRSRANRRAKQNPDPGDRRLPDEPPPTTSHDGNGRESHSHDGNGRESHSRDRPGVETRPVGPARAGPARRRRARVALARFRDAPRRRRPAKRQHIVTRPASHHPCTRCTSPGWCEACRAHARWARRSAWTPLRPAERQHILPPPRPADHQLRWLSPLRRAGAPQRVIMVRIASASWRPSD